MQLASDCAGFGQTRHAGERVGVPAELASDVFVVARESRQPIHPRLPGSPTNHTSG